MRVELQTPSVSVAPGATGELVLEVFNTSDVIDGVSARVVGLDAQWVRCRPAQLALFPESSDTLVLQLNLPHEFPAGHHQVAVEVSSSVHPDDVQYVDLVLDVVPNADVAVQLEPERVSAVRRAKLRATALNAGNAPIAVAFTAVDGDRSLSFRFDPPVVEVPPGAAVGTDIVVRGPRKVFGAPVDRSIVVTASGRDVEASAVATFQHVPLVPRGVLTAGLLTSIVALWAVIFLVVLTQVLSDEPPDKAAPASFFATSAEVLATPAASTGAGGGDAGAGGGSGSGAGAAATKQLDLTAVGASITGTVTAESTQAGVGRITVEAVRITNTGPTLTSSAATDADGTYSLIGLPPGTYSVHFTSPGFGDVWYPAAPTREGGETITLSPQEQRTGVDAVVAGLDGSLAGVVDGGVDPALVQATVTIRPLTGGVPGSPVAVTTTSATGAFAATGLPTPGTYEITAAAPGYDTTTTIETLGGGEQRLAATLRLSAGEGAIAGMVTSDGAPLGGVTIIGTSGDVEVASATPTTGAVGRYVLAGLPTPGTYLLTFSREGFGAETIAVDLGPGELLDALDIALAPGTGSISGTVTDGTGTALGDVVVTVTGGTTTVQTTTLTAGNRGGWSVSGLPPGEYTITFAKEGFASQTIAVTVAEGAVRDADAALPATLASVRGLITGPDGGVAGAAIAVRDGANVRETTSASSPAGAYAATQLPPGSYAITVTAPGFRQRTVLVRLAAGQALSQDIVLTPVSS